MLQVNSFAWIVCLVLSSACGVVIYKRRKDFRGDSAQNNVDFRNLQKSFLFPYLIILFAESLQAPYLYSLLFSYHYTPAQIGVLYVVGIVSNVVFCFYCVHLSSRYGRKALCLGCLAIGSISCTLKYFDSFLLLMLGRIFDGIFSALIASPFQQWYNHEHLVNFDFPSEWISSTFTFVSLGAGFLAVFAGFLSQIVVSISQVAALPFFFSTVGLIIGGVFIGLKWPENKPVDAPLPFITVIGKALNILKSSPIAFVLCIVSCCMESAVQIFVFVWAPVFIRSNIMEHHELSLGIIYGAMVAAYLCGLSLFSSSLTRRITNSKLLIGSALIACIAQMANYSEFPALSNGWPSVRFPVILAYFIVFEFAIGLYNPSMDALQANLLPGLQRSAVLALVRIPVCLISSLSIIMLFPKGVGEHNLFIVICCLLLISTTLSIVLDIALTKKYPRGQNDPNHVYFDLPQSNNVLL